MTFIKWLCSNASLPVRHQITPIASKTSWCFSIRAICRDINWKVKLLAKPFERCAAIGSKRELIKFELFEEQMDQKDQISPGNKNKFRIFFVFLQFWRSVRTNFILALALSILLYLKKLKKPQYLDKANHEINKVMIFQEKYLEI